MEARFTVCLLKTFLTCWIAENIAVVLKKGLIDITCYQNLTNTEMRQHSWALCTPRSLPSELSLSGKPLAPEETGCETAVSWGHPPTSDMHTQYLLYNVHVVHCQCFNSFSLYLFYLILFLISSKCDFSSFFCTLQQHSIFERHSRSGSLQ